jgi:hypothetical protein
MFNFTSLYGPIALYPFWSLMNNDHRDYGDETEDNKDPRLTPAVPYKLNHNDKRMLQAMRISGDE